MYFNESSFQQVDYQGVVSGAYGNPLNYVSIDACKDYVASVTRTNHILMGLLILFGVAMLVWLNRDKIPFFKRMKETKEAMGGLEAIGKQFMEQLNQGDENRRRHNEQTNTSRDDIAVSAEFSDVQPTEDGDEQAERGDAVQRGN